MGHLANINYFIEQIKGCDKVNNPVVGYILARSLGITQMNHQIFPIELAEELKKEHPNFRYHTLDDFLKRKEDILKGKYEMSNGLIIRLNPSYG